MTFSDELDNVIKLCFDVFQEFPPTQLRVSPIPSSIFKLLINGVNSWIRRVRMPGDISMQAVNSLAPLVCSFIGGQDLVEAANATGFHQQLWNVSGTDVRANLIRCLMDEANKYADIRKGDNSVRYMRFLSMISQYSSEGEESFTACQSTGSEGLKSIFTLCQGLLPFNPNPQETTVAWDTRNCSIVKSDCEHCAQAQAQAQVLHGDLLLQISAMDLLPAIVSTALGLQFFCSCHMLEWIVEATSSDADPFISGEVSLTYFPFPCLAFFLSRLAK